jgi:hypothetical protein
MVDFSVDTIDFFYSYIKYNEFKFSAVQNPCSEISLDMWNTTNITSFELMFNKCTELTNIPKELLAPYIPVNTNVIINELSNKRKIDKSKYSVVDTYK